MRLTGYGLKERGAAQTAPRADKRGKAQKEAGGGSPWDAGDIRYLTDDMPPAYMLDRQLPRHNKSMRPHDLRAVPFSA
jgi:hypothetical protein